LDCFVIFQSLFFSFSWVFVSSRPSLALGEADTSENYLGFFQRIVPKSNRAEGKLLEEERVAAGGGLILVVELSSNAMRTTCCQTF
jgi:hypothetical protein